MLGGPHDLLADTFYFIINSLQYIFLCKPNCGLATSLLIKHYLWMMSGKNSKLFQMLDVWDVYFGEFQQLANDILASRTFALIYMDRDSTSIYIFVHGPLSSMLIPYRLFCTDLSDGTKRLYWQVDNGRVMVVPCMALGGRATSHDTCAADFWTATASVVNTCRDVIMRRELQLRSACLHGWRRFVVLSRFD